METQVPLRRKLADCKVLLQCGISPTFSNPGTTKHKKLKKKENKKQNTEDE